ncbi:unnamed protein product [Peronospora belbahrii]|uniref:Anaphase-promoting complex subunit 4 WD40 domain-containing protein n=1 Tax=Peronospora belbahrii TaxID=622444 RepID=A0AAU9LHI1_9STRA|nr:unnamed protein product [Peronospora belbahrii]
MNQYRDYGGSTSRYANSGNGRTFSISDVVFTCGHTALKRWRQVSPPRPVIPSRRSTLSNNAITKRARSKSKSRPRIISHNPTVNHTSYCGPQASDSIKPLRVSAATAARGRSRSSTTGQQKGHSQLIAHDQSNPSPVFKRTRSKSVVRGREDTVTAMRQNQRKRSKSVARRNQSSRLVNASDEQEKRLSRTASRSGQRSSKSASNLEEIEDAIADTEHELAPKKKELDELREKLAKMQKLIEVKELEVYDLQVDLDALQKRRKRRLPSHRSASSEEKECSKRSRSKSTQRESQRLSSRHRGTKRPCIVDEEDDNSDDDVIIINPSEVKRERESSDAVSKSTVVPDEDTMPDHFWGRSPTPKLLANHRFRAIPDGSLRKGRHLAFNPIQPQIFATSPDEGGLSLWSYQRQDQAITKVVSLQPSSFRESSPCAEAIAWSPDGNRMAMAFRDALDEKGEFCIVQLHQLKLEDSRTPQSLPRNRITSKCTTLHPRGISTIGWLPSGCGSETTSGQLVTSGNSDHAVVLWKEHESWQNGGMDLKWSVLHRDHRNEVRSLCVHSKRDCLYTGGFDGLLIRYDLNKGLTETVMERRKPNISKINSVLEHPHNPNLLLVSCVEQTRHSLLLHDLRQRDDANGMTLTWESGSTSQYVVPRWSPAGYHVSCGSKTGVVNIWDVRMRGDKYPTVQPQQALRVHHKTVLHATWHPRYDAMFSVSHDRTIGLLTFR